MVAYGITFEKGIFLAPLSGYTSWPMRMLSREQGAELCYTEMISAEGLVRSARAIEPILKRPDADRPLVAQIFTASPSEAARSARILEDMGFDGIDINMGCPVKKVVSKGAGSALMRMPDNALRLVEAVVSAVRLPVSVKLRAGWDASNINCSDLAVLLAGAGVPTLIIHPRTRSDMYRGTPRWDVLAQAKQRTGATIIASGDIRARDDITRLAGIGADGFMVGRAAIGNPWIFRVLAGGPPPTPSERKEAVLSHLDMLCSLHGKRQGVLHMRKFIGAYVRGLDGAARFRALSCTLEEPEDVKRAVDAFFGGLRHEGLSDLQAHREEG